MTNMYTSVSVLWQDFKKTYALKSSFALEEDARLTRSP